MDPGELKPTRDSKQPVIIEGNWQEPTVEEQLKHDTVHKLEVCRHYTFSVYIQSGLY